MILNKLAHKAIVFALVVWPFSADAESAGTWHHDEELKLNFYYSDKFQPAPAAESSTRFLVQWKGSESGGLIASCFYKALPNQVAGTASDATDEAQRKLLISNPRGFANKLVEREQKIARTVSVSQIRPVVISGLDAVYIAMDGTFIAFDETSHFRSHYVVTVWRGRQVMATCFNHVTLQKLTEGSGVSEEDAQRAIAAIDSEIMKTLRSLSFQRH